jgi:hypothetical protein
MAPESGFVCRPPTIHGMPSAKRMSARSPLSAPRRRRARFHQSPLLLRSLRRRWLVDLQECAEAFADFIEQSDWSHVSYFDVSSLPGETAHLVYQTDARNSVSTWNGNFNWVTSRHGGSGPISRARHFGVVAGDDMRPISIFGDCFTKETSTSLLLKGRRFRPEGL